MAYTLDGNDLGDLQVEDIKKTPQITPLPLPLADSDETDVFDYGGIIRSITITVMKTGSLAERQSLINALEAIADGDQTTTVVYHSDLLDGTAKYPNGNVNVKIGDINYTYDTAAKDKLMVTLKLTESSGRG